jgi:hypothetical protein
VDKKYKDAADRWTLLPKADKGQPIKIDGKSVRNLIDPVAECSTKLIRAVDDWLTREAGIQ